MSGHEQRMLFSSFAINTLLFAVPRRPTECCDVDKRLTANRLCEIYRRSQATKRQISLLNSLFLVRGAHSKPRPSFVSVAYGSSEQRS